MLWKSWLPQTAAPAKRQDTKNDGDVEFIRNLFQISDGWRPFRYNLIELITH